MRANIRKKEILVGILPLVIILAAFLLIPMLFMIVGSLQQENSGGFSLNNYLEILQKPFFYQAFLNSIIVALASSVLGILAGLILCQALLGLSTKVQEKITFVTNLAANFAGVPLAFAFIILLGNSGIFKLIFPMFKSFNLYSWQGLAITYLYFQIPLSVIFLYPALKKMKKEWEEVAALFGASKSYYWRKVMLPILMPSLASTFVILFANGMGTYETAYALVGSNVNLVTTRISALIAGDVYARPNVGSALAVVFAGIMVGMLSITQLLLKRSRRKWNAS